MLQPRNAEWTSPISGASFSKRSLFGAENRSNTVAIFQTKDLIAAQKLAQKSKPKVEKCECPSLKRTIREKARENRQLVDGMMTKGRMCARLQVDLRVMLERAQEHKDEADGAMEQVDWAERERVNLEDMLNNERALHELRMQALERDRNDLMQAHNLQKSELAEMRASQIATQRECEKLRLINAGLQQAAKEAQEQVDILDIERDESISTLDMAVAQGQQSMQESLNFIRRFDVGEI